MTGSGILLVAEQPTLHTPRLVIRPFRPEDAPAVETHASAFEIADTTLSIPHPYPQGGAEAWIATHPPAWVAGTHASFAMTDRGTGELLGAIGVAIAAQHASAELGYWVGVPYWNRGYCTEAGLSMLGFAFDVLELHRVEARHLMRNPASGRVMQKLGMRFEGVHRGALRKWDRFEDVAMYAMLVDEWAASRGHS